MKVERMKSSNDRLVITAIELIAEMFEYAKCHLHIECDEFFDMLNKTHLSNRLYNLDIIYIYGKSSIEIINDIYNINDMKMKLFDKNEFLKNDKYYWIGLVIASYCYGKKISFKEIGKRIKPSQLLKMYNTMHEAPHMKVIDEIDKILNRQESILKHIRQSKNISQSELSILSGVSLRSIQMYEQKKKNISKASFEIVKRLANSLSIKMEDLYESSQVKNEDIIIMY